MTKRPQQQTDPLDELREFSRGVYGDFQLISRDVYLFEQLKAAAQSEYPVLILGPTGTGKELIARAVHGRSSRSSEKLITVNCALIPETLVTSELFGYEEGTFTGARKGGSDGLFQAADKGTIFLDEIGDLPADAQAGILRVIEYHDVQKMGAPTSKKVDVRIIAATNQTIPSDRFREDLFHRLNVFPIHTVGLCAQRAMIPCLLKDLLKESGIRKMEFHFYAFCLLNEWTGNVRELKNFCRQSAARAEDGRVDLIRSAFGFYRRTQRPADDMISYFCQNPPFQSIGMKGDRWDENWEFAKISEKPAELVMYMQFLRYLQESMSRTALSKRLSIRRRRGQVCYPEITISKLPSYDPSDLLVIPPHRIMGKASCVRKLPQKSRTVRITESLLEAIEEWDSAEQVSSQTRDRCQRSPAYLDMPYREAMFAFESDYINYMHYLSGGNQARAARMCGLSRSTLNDRRKKLGLK